MSTSRKVLILCILILFFASLIELLSYAGFSLISKQPFSRAALQTERDEIVYGDPDEKLRHTIEKKFDELKKEGKTSTRKAPLSEIIHPYLGYVFNKSREDCSEYGFVDRRVLDNPTAPVSEKTADNYIVLVIGGSFAYGTSVASSEGYLEERLRAAVPPLKDKRIIIHTVAVGGYKQPQQLMALNYFLSLGAHYDVVLNIDGFNEVALPEFENIAKKVNPFFPRMWWMRMGRINDPEMLVQLAKIELVKDRRKGSARLFSSAPLSASVTANLFWKVFDQYSERRIKAMEEAFTSAKQEEGKKLRYAATGPEFTYSDEEDLYRKLAEHWSRSSLQMHQISRASAIDYFHFLQPNQYVKDSKPMPEEERKQAWLDNHFYKAGVENGYPRLIEEGKRLSEQGVAFHDLTMMFADNQEVLYRDSCCHLNERGYNLVIDRIMAEIGKKYDQGELLSLNRL
ncbi:MAG: hypothetical protein ACOY3O_14560 [Thermodesulfobacteriota bacterium]